LPIRRAHRWVVGVKRIDAIIDSRGDHDVVNAFAGDVHIRHYQRLRIQLIVNGACVKQSKRIRIYVGDVQRRFVEIRPGAGIVVVVSQHRGRARRGDTARRGGQNTQECDNGAVPHIATGRFNLPGN
jgi:hypothetical protein